MRSTCSHRQVQTPSWTSSTAFRDHHLTRELNGGRPAGAEDPGPGLRRCERNGLSASPACSPLLPWWGGFSGQEWGSQVGTASEWHWPLGAARPRPRPSPTGPRGQPCGLRESGWYSVSLGSDSIVWAAVELRAAHRVGAVTSAEALRAGLGFLVQTARLRAMGARALCVCVCACVYMRERLPWCMCVRVCVCACVCVPTHVCVLWAVRAFAASPMPRPPCNSAVTCSGLGLSSQYLCCWVADCPAVVQPSQSGNKGSICRWRFCRRK